MSLAEKRKLQYLIVRDAGGRGSNGEMDCLTRSRRRRRFSNPAGAGKDRVGHTELNSYSMFMVCETHPTVISQISFFEEAHEAHHPSPSSFGIRISSFTFVLNSVTTESSRHVGHKLCQVPTGEDTNCVRLF